jgi:hypothetical protein
MVLISIIHYVVLLIPLALACEIYFLIIRFGVLRGKKLRSSSYAVSLYFIPAFLILWLALNSSKLLLALDYPDTASYSDFDPDFGSVVGLFAGYIYFGTFRGSGFGTFLWLSALTLVLYRGLRYTIRSQTQSSLGVMSWVRSWPGWLGTAMEPDHANEKQDLSKLLMPPAITAALSVSDSARRLGNLFFRGDAVGSSLDVISVLAVTIVVGIAFHSMTAHSLVEDPLHGKRPRLKYPKMVRFGSLFSSVAVIVLWAIASGHEPESDLRIVASELPEPTDRNVSLTLVNRGENTQVLTGLHVESSLNFFEYCLSAQFEIPVVAEYTVKFSIFEPLTTMQLKGEQIKQFPPDTPARINVSLQPDGTGYCGDNWRTDVRLLIVTDDGRRSGTPWFRLQRSDQGSRNRR